MEYERMAAAIYGVPLDEVTPEMRQVGKFVVLGCGFGMGSDKFALQFQEATGITLTEQDATRAVDTYRERKARIKHYWYDVEGAAVKAAMEPGRVTSVGVGAQVRYVVRGQFLWAILPSGRPGIRASQSGGRGDAVGRDEARPDVRGRQHVHEEVAAPEHVRRTPGRKHRAGRGP